MQGRVAVKSLSWEGQSEMTLNMGLGFLLGSVLLHLCLGREAGPSVTTLSCPWLHLGI